MTKVEKELLDKLGNVRNQLIDLRDKYKNIHHVVHDSTVAGLNRIISETFIAIEMNTGDIVHSFFDTDNEKTGKYVLDLKTNQVIFLKLPKELMDKITNLDTQGQKGTFDNPIPISIKKDVIGDYKVTIDSGITYNKLDEELKPKITKVKLILRKEEVESLQSEKDITLQELQSIKESLTNHDYHHVRIAITRKEGIHTMITIVT